VSPTTRTGGDMPKKPGDGKEGRGGKLGKGSGKPVKPQPNFVPAKPKPNPSKGK